MIKRNILLKQLNTQSIITKHENKHNIWANGTVFYEALVGCACEHCVRVVAPCTCAYVLLYYTVLYSTIRYVPLVDIVDRCLPFGNQRAQREWAMSAATPWQNPYGLISYGDLTTISPTIISNKQTILNSTPLATYFLNRKQLLFVWNQSWWNCSQIPIWKTNLPISAPLAHFALRVLPLRSLDYACVVGLHLRAQLLEAATA